MKVLDRPLSEFRVLGVALLVWLALGGGPFGCTPAGVAIGAGAATATAAQKEKGLKAAVSDAAIEAVLNEKLLEAGGKLFWDVNTEVEEGRVLLTGTVDKVAHRLEAVKIAWGVDGVSEVINEIEVYDDDSVANFARDSWITAQLDTALLFDKDVRSIDYSFETVNQVVYIMGIARTEAALQRVIGHAKDIPYVRRVVSYVRVVTPPAVQPPSGASGSTASSGS